MRILITGASGFVGSMLTWRLATGEHELRAISREPERVHSALQKQLRRERIDALERHPLEVLRADALSGEGLARALDGVELAYYLIHSMQASLEGSFCERERRAARNFAEAAAAAGVRRIVYLGGIIPTGLQASAHLASRQEVEQILLEAVPDSLALRASIVIGAGSRSFRLLVRLIERMPVLVLPSWRRFRTQPIDARDVIQMLLAAAHAPAGLPRSLDIGGPETLSYEQMIRRIATMMLLDRPRVALRASLTPLIAPVAAALAAEDPQLIGALMEGLSGDLLAADERAARLLKVRLHDFDSAVEHALGEWESIEPLAAR
jgi:uncharacterized protein YbjT (DUF2867 family)